MDDRVKRLKTPEECEVFAYNATERGHPELVTEARQRAIELLAAAFGATSDAERECLEAIYAYEEILFSKHGKRVKASRTWKMIKRRRILAAIEQAVDRLEGTAAFNALKQVGLALRSLEQQVFNGLPRLHNFSFK